MFKRVSPMSHFERNYKISLKESIGFLNKCLGNHENSWKIDFILKLTVLHDYLELVVRSKHLVNHKMHSLSIPRYKSTIGTFFSKFSRVQMILLLLPYRFNFYNFSEISMRVRWKSTSGHEFCIKPSNRRLKMKL